jgi:hypothetical protein
MLHILPGSISLLGVGENEAVNFKCLVLELQPQFLEPGFEFLLFLFADIGGEWRNC